MVKSKPLALLICSLSAVTASSIFGAPPARASTEPGISNGPEENLYGSYWRPRHYYPHYGYGYGYGYYGYRPSYYCYYNYLGNSVCYLMSATAAAFSEVIANDTDYQRESIYQRAAEDADRYLRDGGEPTQELRAAMDSERELVRRSGLSEEEGLTDRTLAGMVFARAEELRSAVR